MITLEIVGNFRLSIKHDTFQCILLCIWNLGHCIFPHNTTREGVALKPQYLFVSDVMPFPANQKIKYELHRCAFQIFHIFASTVV